MRRFTASLAAFACAASLLCGGCAPPKVEQFAEIEKDEMGFLVPVEGENKDSQAEISSAEAYKDAKVLGKRISLPLRLQTQGRFDWKWIPTMRVIKAKRTPVTRVWTADPFSGTSAKNEALDVQSKDGVKLAVPVVASALITDEDGPLFQASYHGKTLEQVLDEDVRGHCLTQLQKKFQQAEMLQGREEKVTYLADVEKSGQEVFKAKGVTLLYVGSVKGLIYKDKQVQASIDKEYLKQLEERRLGFQKLAEQVRNQTAVEVAEASQQAAQLAEEVKEPLQLMVALKVAQERADVNVTAGGKFAGKMPRMVLPAGAQQPPVLLNLNSQ
jgi:hypothetical protein